MRAFPSAAAAKLEEAAATSSGLGLYGLRASALSIVRRSGALSAMLTGTADREAHGGAMWTMVARPCATYPPPVASSSRDGARRHRAMGAAARAAGLASDHRSQRRIGACLASAPGLAPLACNTSISHALDTCGCATRRAVGGGPTSSSRRPDCTSGPAIGSHLPAKRRIGWHGSRSERGLAKAGLKYRSC